MIFASEAIVAYITRGGQVAMTLGFTEIARIGWY